MSDNRAVNHDYEAFQQSVAYDRILDSLPPDVRVHPDLPEVIDAVLKANGQAPSPLTGTDLGLADLIGLGRDAAKKLEDQQVSQGVDPYDDQVAADRIAAVADLYYLYLHDRAGVFQVVHKLQQLFRAGTLRLATGGGAFGLYRFDKRAILRYPLSERLRVYKRVFGYGPARPPEDGRANPEFHPLFTQLVREIAKFWRDKRVSEVIRTRANDPTFGSIAVVRRAGLDLRNNLKNASYGYVNVLRTELSQMLEDAFIVLGAPDVRDQFGAASAWDVVELVMWQYFQRTVPASTLSRMAATGRLILRWVGTNDLNEDDRSKFEAKLYPIAEPAEEWISSYEGLRATRPTPPARGVYRSGPPPSRGSSRDPVFGGTNGNGHRPVLTGSERG
jgi:hypothetical protein